MSTEYKAYLVKMNAGYKKSQQVYDDEFVLFPACISVFRLKSADIGKRDNGAHYIKSKWVIIDDETPDMKGRVYTDFQNLPDVKAPPSTQEKQFAFVRKWFHSMGFQAPEELTELPAMLNQLIEATVKVKGQIKHNEGYANMTILGLVESDGEESAEEEEVVEETTEEEVVEETTEEDVDLLIAACEAAGLEFEEEQPDSVEAVVAYLQESYDIDYNDLDEDARDDCCALLVDLGVEVANYTAEEAAKEEVEDSSDFLRTTANDLGCDEDFTDEDTEAELVAKMNAYEWKKKDLKDAKIPKDVIDKLIALGLEIK